ncbi:11979_t:CDS:2 [Acaulospora colombiana]|uniref:11979_t:CDS:1 n=1 Tax=Acaulospora colombiana TaxID=27376 RepID=A0ACA9KIQ5_9GLOM|nr:11979_t:CDS:2 [Acaulospora colombiana]
MIAVERVILIPRRKRKAAERLTILRERNAEHIANRKREAEEAIRLLKPSVEREPSSTEGTFDVTIPVQALVHESQLTIPGGYSKKANAIALATNISKVTTVINVVEADDLVVVGLGDDPPVLVDEPVVGLDELLGELLGEPLDKRDEERGYNAACSRESGNGATNENLAVLRKAVIFKKKISQSRFLMLREKPRTRLTSHNVNKVTKVFDDLDEPAPVDEGLPEDADVLDDVDLLDDIDDEEEDGPDEELLMIIAPHMPPWQWPATLQK